MKSHYRAMLREGNENGKKNFDCDCIGCISRKYGTSGYRSVLLGAIDKDTGVKVDGNEKVFWPYEYKALDICSMPVKMEIGMYVEVQDCTDRKIILKQVDCGDIGKGSGDFPCYNDCEKFSLRANFDVKLGTRLVKAAVPEGEEKDTVMDQWEGYYNGSDVVPGDGKNHEVEVCVRAWKARLWYGTYGDETVVGTLYVTAKPDV